MNKMVKVKRRCGHCEWFWLTGRKRRVEKEVEYLETSICDMCERELASIEGRDRYEN